MVATNELKVDQFIQDLKKTIVRDPKAGGIKGVPFAEIVDRALEAEQAEKDILDEERAIRERQARQAHQNFRPGYQGGIGGQTQVQCPQDAKRKMTPFQQPRPDQGKHPKTDQKNTTTSLPQCVVCDKFYDGECRKAAELCYRCGKRGHFIKNYPEAANDQKKPGSRLYDLADTKIGTDVEVTTEADPSVITGEVFISGIITYTLIDSGSTHSHASLKFVRRLGRSTDQMSTPFGTTLSSREVMYSDRILRACPIIVDDRKLLADLIVLYMIEYEIILGMDWLSKYHAKIDCRKKIVVFHPLDTD